MLKPSPEPAMVSSPTPGAALAGLSDSRDELSKPSARSHREASTTHRGVKVTYDHGLARHWGVPCDFTLKEIAGIDILAFPSH